MQNQFGGQWLTGNPRIISALCLAITAGHFFLLSAYATVAGFVHVDNSGSHVNATEMVRFAHSPLDFSVLTPFRGLGGPIPPFGGALLHPAYLPLRWNMDEHACRTLAYMVTIPVYSFVVLLLARTMGLTIIPSMLAAQVFSVIAFYPFRTTPSITHQFRYNPQSTIPACMASMLFLLAWQFKLNSTKHRICIFLFIVVLFWWSFFCDPLFMPVATLAPAIVCLLLTIVATRHVRMWRVASALACILGAIVMNLPRYYSLVSQCAARMTFPLEISSEPQLIGKNTIWLLQDRFGSMFYLCIIIACITLIWRGDWEKKCLGLSILMTVLCFLAISLFYLYGEQRWRLPMPTYCNC